MIRDMAIHYFQSEAWKKFQAALGNDMIEGQGEGWSYQALVNHDRFGTFVYAPYGPAADTVEALSEAIDDMTKKAKELSAYSIIVEPYLPITRGEVAKLIGNKAKRLRQRQVVRTLFVDLTASEEEIIARMSATRRKQHRNSYKKGITIEKSADISDINVFYDLLKRSSDEKGFFIRSKRFYDVMAETLVKDGDAAIYLGKVNGEVEIAALVYDAPDMRIYAHVGRNLEHNNLQVTAPLISHMIIDAKREGKKIFDMSGISESDEVKDEKSGFTVFKRTFGGEEVEFAGPWEIPLDPMRYRLKESVIAVKRLLGRGKKYDV